ncbi:SMC-Scp complex subunit ScpB [Arthrobacter sp. H14-L1]|uniref:SMC-Scp complex subunit ScpB n=1 Tax=Arthrobacter sp. H14-L1 TaxID=2996697 RepID=UPI00226E6381|nr:SMC-Scp complex subunit ScpB [Arthrobacter sp. H14-L1]MCY0904200.1 SMC-Scp complex subunit ScpB [Arthrobacter sp. H14-L1]
MELINASMETESMDAVNLPGGAKAALEAVLMVTDEPVSEAQLAAVVGLGVDQVSALLVALQLEYDGYTSTGKGASPVSAAPVSTASVSEASVPPAPVPAAPRGFELRNVAGGWRIYSRRDFAHIVSRFVMDGQTARLTQAALETLAVIAYRQPVSRARVSAIRGVNVDSVVRSLAQRGLIEESGTDAESGAVLYQTTDYFLERMGISSAEDLPQLAPHLPGLENLQDFEDSSY